MAHEVNIWETIEMAARLGLDVHLLNPDVCRVLSAVLTLRDTIAAQARQIDALEDELDQLRLLLSVQAAPEVEGAAI